MTETEMKQRITELESDNAELINELHDANEELERTEEKLEQAYEQTERLQDELNRDESGYRIATEMHWKITVQNHDPLELLNELFEDNQLYWKRVA